jgi:hypothetical protein
MPFRCLGTFTSRIEHVSIEILEKMLCC